MNSLAGFVSESLRNSARVIGLVVAVMVSSHSDSLRHLSTPIQLITGFPVDTTCSIISTAWQTRPARRIASCNLSAFCLYEFSVSTRFIASRSLGTLKLDSGRHSPAPVQAIGAATPSWSSLYALYSCCFEQMAIAQTLLIQRLLKAWIAINDRPWPLI